MEFGFGARYAQRGRVGIVGTLTFRTLPRAQFSEAETRFVGGISYTFW